MRYQFFAGEPCHHIALPRRDSLVANTPRDVRLDQQPAGAGAFDVERRRGTELGERLLELSAVGSNSHPIPCGAVPSLEHDGVAVIRHESFGSMQVGEYGVRRHAHTNGFGRAGQQRLIDANAIVVGRSEGLTY